VVVFVEEDRKIEEDGDDKEVHNDTMEFMVPLLLLVNASIPPLSSSETWWWGPAFNMESASVKTDVADRFRLAVEERQDVDENVVGFGSGAADSWQNLSRMVWGSTKRRLLLLLLLLLLNARVVKGIFSAENEIIAITRTKGRVEETNVDRALVVNIPVVRSSAFSAMDNLLLLLGRIFLDFVELSSDEFRL